MNHSMNLKDLIIRRLSEASPSFNYKHICQHIAKQIESSQNGDLKKELLSKLKFGSEQEIFLTEEAGKEVRRILFELATAGVISFGAKHSKGEHYEDDKIWWPHFALTEWGKEQIKKKPPWIYDGYCFIKNIKEQIPDLDSVIEEYYAESIHAFNLNLFFASAVILGGAAERSIEMLVEALDKFFDARSPKNSNLKKAKNARTISEKEKRILECIKAEKRGTLKNPAFSDYEHKISPIFNSIRLARNEKGHPKNIDIDQLSNYSHLLLFRIHLLALFPMIRWLQDNSSTQAPLSQN